MAKSVKKNRRIKILPLSEKDHSFYWDLIQVLESTLLGERYPHHLSELYSETRNVPRTIVAVCGDAVVGGIIRGECPSGDVTVRYIGVAPELQGTGIGKTLMEHVEKFAKRTSAPGVKLETTPDVSDFFARRGYNIANKTTNPADSREYLIMAKQL